jgi:uncharacterized protein
MGMFRFIKLCLAAMAVLATAGPHVAAQDGDAIRFFQQNQPTRSLFRPLTPQARPSATRPGPQVRPVSRPQRDIDDDDDYVRPAARRPVAPAIDRAPEQAALPPPDRPPVPVSLFVYVLGDSLAELLGQGLKEHLTDRSDIGVQRKARSSSGLVRDDFFDWTKALKDLLGGQEKVDVVVMMVGSNDRQILRDDTGTHEFRSDRWRELYTRRLDDFLAVARDKRVPVVWVGMPVMQSQRLSADMIYINGLARERVQRAGGTYVDIWEGFTSEQGQYAAVGPDVNGEIVRLRTADGIHFTKAGQKKLGFFSGREVIRLLAQERSGVAVASLPSDLSEQIRRETSLPGLQPTVPLPDALPSLPVIRERPVAGQIIELTALPSTPGGQLLRGKIVAPANEMSIMVEQALGYGRMPLPKPGRADDFRRQQ